MRYPRDQAADESAVHPAPAPCLPEEDEDEDENWGAGEPGIDYEDDEDL